jgi:hypothetical protein
MAISFEHLSTPINLDLKIDSKPMEIEKNNPSSKDVHQSVKSQEVRSFFMPNVGRSLFKRASIAHTEGNVQRSSRESQSEKLIFGVPSLRCSVSINQGPEYNDCLAKGAMFMPRDQGKNIESTDSPLDFELKNNEFNSSDRLQKMGAVFKESRFSSDNFNVHIDGCLSTAQTFGRNSYVEDAPKFQMGGFFGQSNQTNAFPLSTRLHGKRNSVTVGDSDINLKTPMSLDPLIYSKAEDRPMNLVSPEV